MEDSPRPGETARAGHLRVAYAIQNVGGIDLRQDIGDAVPVKNTLKGLKQAGQEVTCLRLQGRSVVGFDDVTDLGDAWEASLGLSATKPFLLFESAVRRMQRVARLPYFAFFDSYRFYEACLRFLPGFDLCHEHHGLFSVGAARACRKLRIPYVLTFSADPLLEKRLKGQALTGIHAAVAERETRFAFRLARAIICVSEPARQNLIENWQVEAAKIAVLPNGVDLGLFGAQSDPASARAEMGLDGAPVVVFVGGFQVWHGLDQLLDSFAQVVRAIPDARLLLVGDGPSRGEIERRSVELGLESAVRITGLVAQERVPAMLAAADVAVLPYPRLPQDLWFSPLKLYEYMAAGKAIVASRSGQIAEVIQDGRTGLLVEAGDAAEFARATIGLLRDPEKRRRLGRNAREQAGRHSWEAYIQRLLEVYRGALTGGVTAG